LRASLHRVPGVVELEPHHRGAALGPFEAAAGRARLCLGAAPACAARRA
jgi:hypothetical protein